MKNKYSSRGFTLLEALVILAIIGLLVSIAIPMYKAYLEKAYAKACLAERETANKMILLYCSENTNIPLTNLSQLVSAGTIKALPQCPQGGEYMLIPGDENSGYPAVGCSLHYWPAADTPPPAISNILAADDFSNGNSDNWVKKGSYWQAADGKYFGGKNGVNTGENRTFFGDETWSDYTIDLDVNLLSGGPGGFGYGIYFRAQDYSSLDAYVFQYDPGWVGGSFIIRKIVNGYEQNPFAVAKAPVGYDWTGTGKHVSIAVSGDTFKVYVSDVNGGTTPVMEARDSSYASGATGLRTWNSSYASFDNVSVSKNAYGAK